MKCGSSCKMLHNTFVAMPVPPAGSPTPVTGGEGIIQITVSGPQSCSHHLTWIIINMI